MEGHADFEDWEILLGSEEAGQDLKQLESSSDASDDAAIKSDYFALDFHKSYQEGTASAGIIHTEKVEQVDSDSSTRVDPHSDSLFLDRPKGEVSFSRIELPSKDLSEPSSNEISNDRELHVGGEKGEPEDAGCLEIGENTGGDEEGDKEVGLRGSEEIEGSELGFDKPGEEDSVVHAEMTHESYNSSVETGDENIGSDNILANGGEMRGVVWWKLPFELLKFYAFKVKPVWSVSVAAAILGVWMLRKRLYRMKRKAKSIPLMISLDEKKASQLKIHASRLNEAFTVGRRIPVIKVSLSAVSMTAPRSILGLHIVVVPQSHFLLPGLKLLFLDRRLESHAGLMSIHLGIIWSEDLIYNVLIVLNDFFFKKEKILHEL
ncbi:hypothetical protein Cni_G26691 [Canna indica]|uniref:Transmembrane protein n=1 Tax=Canna indica TaxID=4628 RepID=A0AAQ3KZG0_9LILI|nr:hypothetical protein Cni_G26691 [Canna indica]